LYFELSVILLAYVPVILNIKPGQAMI